MTSNQEQAEAFACHYCDNCRLSEPNEAGDVKCYIMKKLIVDLNPIAWKNKHLFVNSDGRCKSMRPKKVAMVYER